MHPHDRKQNYGNKWQDLQTLTTPHVTFLLFITEAGTGREYI
jgi:hypothetical protein